MSECVCLFVSVCVRVVCVFVCVWYLLLRVQFKILYVMYVLR